ncbi:MAG: IclR family transcriptional regulator [Pseudomonadota bacterium]
MPESERIPTNLRTLLILEVLGTSDRAMTATEINESIGLPRQTIHRLCATLESNGFIAREGSTRRYYAARRLRALGAGLLNNSRHHIARRQILTDLASKVQETVNFVVPEGDGMSYVDRVETDWAFQVQLPIGSHVPFHCTASGKSFLASLSRRKRDAVLSSLTLERLTSQTKTRPEDLADELEEISNRGYSLDNEEFIEGMVAIAVPVTDMSGRFAAAVAFHGPTQRLTIDDAVARKAHLQDAAHRLQDALFGD